MVRRLIKLMQILLEYLQDSWRFTYYNSHSPFQPRSKRIGYHTVIETHTVEKGLVLPKPRPFFGLEKISSILKMQQIKGIERAPFPRRMLLGALAAYLEWHKKYPNPQPEIVEKIEKFVREENLSGVVASGGVRNTCPPINNLAAQEFLMSRFSSRVFDAEPLPTNLVEQIVLIAQQAPSQCNRQSSKVYHFFSKEIIMSLLDLQGGSKGFSDNVPTLFLITSDITAWGGAQQRHQLYVDGGLFSMQLMLAMHAFGVLNCPLNLAVSNSTESAIKRIANIPASERVIMMVAAGLPSRSGNEKGILSVAASPRRSLEEVLFTSRN
ncbi:nitroreductase family protein [Limnobacter sp.]|uniref:nitroreductase family protein n=1 Tax=Limnobacter sp. TaxID=2003368 RepID=UPI0025C0938E|nr:nitroreductase family protein [Limnobacter sp.]